MGLFVLEKQAMKLQSLRRKKIGSPVKALYSFPFPYISNNGCKFKWQLGAVVQIYWISYIELVWSPPLHVLFHLSRLCTRFDLMFQFSYFVLLNLSYDWGELTFFTRKELHDSLRIFVDYFSYWVKREPYRTRLRSYKRGTDEPRSLGLDPGFPSHFC